jgi:hypothetical protein
MNLHPSSINVAISGFDGFEHGSLLCVSILPGTKANGRYFSPSVELELGSSHFVLNSFVVANELVELVLKMLLLSRLQSDYDLYIYTALGQI